MGSEDADCTTTERLKADKHTAASERVTASGAVPLPLDFNFLFKFYCRLWADPAQKQTSKIALDKLKNCGERGIPPGIVLADAGYDNDHVFREGLEALSLSYIVGIKGNTGVWGPGMLPTETTPEARYKRSSGY